MEQFGDVLMPVLREIGVEGEPEIYPSHTYVSAQSSAQRYRSGLWLGSSPGTAGAHGCGFARSGC